MTGDFNWLKGCEFGLKNNHKLLNILHHQNFFIFLCMYKMIEISAETWRNAAVSVLKIHENNDVNKTFLLALCISDISKRLGCTSICERNQREI